MRGYVFLFLFMGFFLITIQAEECNLEDNCRLVDVNGDDDWVNIPGHYKTIQGCVDEAEAGDTCLIRSGRYHEEIEITNKNNIAIRGDLDYTRPIVDGTVILKPKADYDSDGDGVGDGKWKEDEIDGHKVCTGELEIDSHYHPFQLFVKENDDHEMMTNARWPNAVWNDRHERTGAPLVFYNDYWGKSDETSEPGKMVDMPVDGVSRLAASGLNVKGTAAILNVGSFMTWVRPVLEHNPGDDTFTYEMIENNHKFSVHHNQYYLDSSEEFLDIPGEWVYTKHTRMLRFMPLSGSCPDSSSDAVRGRVIDYAMVVTFTDGLNISDLDFFGANIVAKTTSKHMEINEIYLESLNFMYPSSSKRMLQDYSIPNITEVVAGAEGTVSIKNCVFFGSEGSALSFYGKNAKVENNLFQWNDWTGQQGDPMLDSDTHGGCGTVFTSRSQIDEEFVGNTFWYNGASAGYMPGKAPLVSDNWVVGQCDGLILNDGSGITTGSSCQPGAKILSNWIFDSPKSGLRFDGGSEKQGFNGTMANNVLWKVGGFAIKGDRHNITGNLGLADREPEDGVLKVIYILRKDYEYIMNNDTIVEDNAAWLADGGRDAITYPHDQGNWEMAGIKSNNFYGNNGHVGHIPYDGSVVLDGEIVPEMNGTDLPNLLVDVESHDFRPKPGSILTSTGKQIGPFKSEWSNGDHYRMAGRKEYKATRPIPKHESTGAMRDSLIFHSAYRCNGKDDKHMVYIAKESSDFPSEDEPTTEMGGDGNVIVLKDIDFIISPGKSYKWRVDCVEGDTNQRRTGDTWLFKMSSEEI